MKVWIDQDLCTGDGLCEEIAPDVFTLLDDGLVSIKVSSIFLCRPARAPSITLLSSNGQEILKFRQTARTEAA